jgi:two-component system, cell cycle response regulator DivK
MVASALACRAGGNTVNVLIVEENDLNVKLFKDLLECQEYKVHTTASGNEAIMIARDTRPDLILLDVQLPDISGQEVERLLKADEATRSIPIVKVTAFAMRGDEGARD